MFLPRPNAQVRPSWVVQLLNRPILTVISIISTSNRLKGRQPRQLQSDVTTTTTLSMTHWPLDLSRLAYKIWRNLQMPLSHIQASLLTLLDCKLEQLGFLWLSGFTQEVLELHRSQLPFRLTVLSPSSFRWVQYQSTPLAVMSSILSQMILCFQQPRFGHTKEAA